MTTLCFILFYVTQFKVCMKIKLIDFLCEFEQRMLNETYLKVAYIRSIINYNS